MHFEPAHVTRVLFEHKGMAIHSCALASMQWLVFWNWSLLAPKKANFGNELLHPPIVVNLWCCMAQHIALHLDSPPCKPYNGTCTQEVSPWQNQCSSLIHILSRKFLPWCSSLQQSNRWPLLHPRTTLHQHKASLSVHVQSMTRSEAYICLAHAVKHCPWKAGHSLDMNVWAFSTNIRRSSALHCQRSWEQPNFSLVLIPSAIVSSSSITNVLSSKAHDW